MVAQTRRRAAAAERTEATTASASSAAVGPSKTGADTSKRLGKPATRARTESNASSLSSAGASPAPFADDQAPTAKSETLVNVPTIPLYDFDLPLELDTPYGSRISAFNPAPYEDLRRKFNEWFPDLACQDEGQINDSAPLAGNEGSRDSKLERRTGKSKSAVAASKEKITVKSSQRKGKAKKPDCVHLEVEFVPAVVSDLDLQLPRTAKGFPGIVSYLPHSAYAVIALAPPDYAPKEAKPRRGRSATVDTEARDASPSASDEQSDDDETLLLGYIIPSAFKDTTHPLAHMDPVLLSKEWIQLYGEVTLVPPFLPPRSEVFGPDSFEQSGKRGSSFAPKSSQSTKKDPWPEHTLGSGDSTDAVAWPKGPYVPSTRLLGVLSVQVGLEPAALQYGAGDDNVDGFVASNTDLKDSKAAGSLTLAKFLRQAIPSIADWEHSFIELDMHGHSYWDRNESFYDLPPKQATLARHLVLDKVESVDLPASANSTSKKRKKVSASSRPSATSTSRISLWSVPPQPRYEDDLYDGFDRCTCPECRESRRWDVEAPRRSEEASRPVEAPRPKLDALSLGEQVSATDPRLGDVTSETFLPLDTNIASLLEACRPPAGGPKVFPPSDVIPTPLLGYQARCLAWMIKRETVVDEDVGHLMPNWFPLRCKGAERITQRRLQLEAEREALLDAIHRGLSRSRRNVNVKSAQAAARSIHHADGGGIASGSLKREPFIDPSHQVFYFDQVSGLLSLRRFPCRRSEPGGALCESMGLGKTLESLSLIAAHPRPDNPDLLAYDTSRSARMIADMEPSERPFISRATLVVCPAALVEQWMDEIRKHFRSRLPLDTDVNAADDASLLNRQPGVLRYKHSDFGWDITSSRKDVRALAKKKLVQPDIVVATYEELAFQLSESHRVARSDDQVRTPLLEVLFWRILLDEAQIVAGASGKATNMVHELWRSNCWMVTGTPVTKGIRDIQGIFAFMDHDPFAAPRFFREILQEPFSRGCVEGIRRLRAILPRFVWRHTQAHVEDEIVLPPCKSEVLEIDLKHVERLFYDKEVRKFRENFAKQAARGVANVAQPSFLVHLRQLLSHPQVADELMYFHNYSRLSFAELFRRFCQQAECELESTRLNVVNTTLQLVWGHDFYGAETDKRFWRGSRSPLQQPEDIRNLLESALRIVNIALEEKARRVMLAAARKQQEEEAQPEQNGPEVPNARPLPLLEAAEDVYGDAANIPATPPLFAGSLAAQDTEMDDELYERLRADPNIRFGINWEEARYWLQTLLQKHADPSSADEDAAPIEPPRRWDPERPTRAVFDKEFKNANDKSVDLKDPRYHLVVQDASAEDMDEEDYLAQIEAARIADSIGDDGDAPRKKVKMDAAFEPGTLKKSRLRGKASQRQAARVWFYKPKERLDTTHSKLQQYQTSLPSKEHELAFLRQQLDEGLAVDANAGTSGEVDASVAAENDAAAVSTSAPECGICYEPKVQIGVLPCYHSFCVECIDMLCKNLSTDTWYSASYNQPRCPSCRLRFSPGRVTRVMERGRSASTDGFDEVVGDWSGKISGVILNLKARLSQDPTHKAVVFSHWPKMLTFVREALTQNGVPAVVFGGNEAKQAEALRAIRDDDDVKVILVPFRASAGAAGLTLTSCDLAYLMEPALDAALEAQAIGRIHRIGQRRDTTVIRVKMKDTIEDAVMRIAEERSRRGMALATHTDVETVAATASHTAEAGAASASSVSATESSAASGSRTTMDQSQAAASAAVHIKSEDQDTLPPVPPPTSTSTTTLRERSIKSSVGASVGVGRESDNTSLTMAEVGLILGFDVEEEKRKARQRRESLARRASDLWGRGSAQDNYWVQGLNERELDDLEEELAADEEDRAEEEAEGAMEMQYPSSPLRFGEDDSELPEDPGMETDDTI